MRPISRVIALALALLPLGCAGHAEPPRPAAVTARATAPPPAPIWPDAAPGPAAPSPDAPGPVPAPEAMPGNDQFTAREELPDVRFAPGEIRAQRRDLSRLHVVAAWLKANPSQLVIVEGHTDAAGPRAANLALAQRRAQWVMDYLVAKGVPAERVTVVARGESDTLCAEKSTACQSRNRRVHFLVRESGPLQLSASPSP